MIDLTIVAVIMGMGIVILCSGLLMGYAAGRWDGQCREREAMTAKIGTLRQYAFFDVRSGYQLGWREALDAVEREEPKA